MSYERKLLRVQEVAEPRTPLVAKRKEAAEMLGVSEFQFTAGVKAGRYPAPCVDLGRTKRWSLRHLRDFLNPPTPTESAPAPKKAPWQRMPKRVPLGPGVQHLYRHFDAEGRLLYVGVSLSAIGRLAEHKQNAEWFWRIARVEVTAYANRRAVLKAERITIQREKPLHNIVHARRKA